MFTTSGDLIQLSVLLFLIKPFEKVQPFKQIISFIIIHILIYAEDLHNDDICAFLSCAILQTL